MLVISELRGLKQEDHHLGGLGYIHSEFQASLVAIMRLCFKQEKKPQDCRNSKGRHLQLFLTEFLEEEHQQSMEIRPTQDLRTNGYNLIVSGTRFIRDKADRAAGPVLSLGSRGSRMDVSRQEV